MLKAFSSFLESVELWVEILFNEEKREELLGCIGKRIGVDFMKRLFGGCTKYEVDETFFTNAPQLNPSRGLIKGVVCGGQVEDIEEQTMKEIPYSDKLIDELAKGKAMNKILRN